mgnify:CR=1 FL=1
MQSSTSKFPIAILLALTLGATCASAELMIERDISITDDAGTVSGAMTQIVQASAASYSSTIGVIWEAEELVGPAENLERETENFLKIVN